LQDFKEVLGLELVKEAVEDAKQNAIRNNIENCQFFCGNAEAIMSSVVSRAQGSHVVAVLDPPRAGLRKSHLFLSK
jgi:tRNA/tmRNA/rRNA uracil-C5-methylase (TrmA/RlmC/RlmD family)